MAEFTKEEQIQAIYDLKVGYTLGHADIEMLKAMARQLLAGLEQGPVAYIGVKMLNDMQDECRKTGRVWISDTGLGDCVPLYAAPQLPQPEVPDMATVETTYPDVQTNWQDEKMYAEGWNACRAAMLQSGNFRENKDSSTNNFRETSETSTNSPVTPARLPGGFTIEDAKELHEDLVRSHISQALSGEKMKKNDRDADLRWIHGVIVQAAWFVKASLEQNALSGNYPVTTDGWISCSERMPDKLIPVMVMYEDGEMWSAMWNGNRWDDGTEYPDPHSVTHWREMPAAPKQEVKP